MDEPTKPDDGDAHKQIPLPLPGTEVDFDTAVAWMAGGNRVKRKGWADKYLTNILDEEGRTTGFKHHTVDDVGIWHTTTDDITAVDWVIA